MATSNKKNNPIPDEVDLRGIKWQMELAKLLEEMTEDAKAMVEDYIKNPSAYSGSIDVEKGLVKGDGVVVHEDSPLLKEDDKDDKESGRVLINEEESLLSKEERRRTFFRRINLPLKYATDLLGYTPLHYGVLQMIFVAQFKFHRVAGGPGFHAN